MQNKMNESLGPSDQPFNCAVLVVGDLNRSPRMLNHCAAISNSFDNVKEISLIGFNGGDLRNDILSNNIKILQEACQASSDYFTLLERKVKIDLSQSTYRPPKDQVQGRIEFKNINFIVVAQKPFI